MKKSLFLLCLAALVLTGCGSKSESKQESSESSESVIVTEQATESTAESAKESTKEIATEKTIETTESTTIEEVIESEAEPTTEEQTEKEKLYIDEKVYRLEVPDGCEIKEDDSTIGITRDGKTIIAAMYTEEDVVYYKLMTTSSPKKTIANITYKINEELIDELTLYHYVTDDYALTFGIAKGCEAEGEKILETVILK